MSNVIHLPWSRNAEKKNTLTTRIEQVFSRVRTRIIDLLKKEKDYYNFPPWLAKATLFPTRTRVGKIVSHTTLALSLGLATTSLKPINFHLTDDLTLSTLQDDWQEILNLKVPDNDIFRETKNYRMYRTTTPNQFVLQKFDKDDTLQLVEVDKEEKMHIIRTAKKSQL